MQPREYDILHELEANYWWHIGMRYIMDQILLPTIAADSRLLDVGCGTGANLRKISQHCQTWGIDYHQSAVDYSRGLGLENIEQGDATRLPYPDGMFTHVMCCEVLQNLEDDLAGIREAHRVLKPGGFYYITEQAYPILRGEHDISQEAVRRYTRRRLTEFLTKAGFSIERFTFANTILFPIAAAVRLTSRVLHPPAKVTPEESRSDVRAVPGPVNSVLAEILKLEGKWIGRGRDLPYGLTIITLARKP